MGVPSINYDSSHIDQMTNYLTTENVVVTGKFQTEALP